jgi:hypothetical protein
LVEGHIIAQGADRAHIQPGVNDLLVPGMRDILKLLNDRSAGDLRELSDDELRSFEALCDNWRTFVQAELARRASLPRQTGAGADSG